MTPEHLPYPYQRPINSLKLTPHPPHPAHQLLQASTAPLLPPLIPALAHRSARGTTPPYTTDMYGSTGFRSVCALLCSGAQRYAHTNRDSGPVLHTLTHRHLCQGVDNP
jgi:hypothetical protein